MDANQCNQKAAECAANAQLAVDETMSMEFMKMAAQWRAMAIRDIFLGPIEAYDAVSVEACLAEAPKSLTYGPRQPPE